jgi:hypothetical protein
VFVSGQPQAIWDANRQTELARFEDFLRENRKDRP